MGNSADESEPESHRVNLTNDSCQVGNPFPIRKGANIQHAKGFPCQNAPASGLNHVGPGPEIARIDSKGQEIQLVSGYSLGDKRLLGKGGLDVNEVGQLVFALLAGDDPV